MPPRVSNTQRGLPGHDKRESGRRSGGLGRLRISFLERQRGGSGQGRSEKGGARVDRAPLKFNMT